MIKTLANSLPGTVLALVKYVDFANPDIPYTEADLKTYFIYTKKPDVKYDADKKCYKNGIAI